MVAHLTKVKISGTDLALWGGQKLVAAAKVLDALESFEGAKMTLLIKEAYRKGKADGARKVVENVQDALKQSSRTFVRRGIALPKRGAKHDGQRFIFDTRRN